MHTINYRNEITFHKEMRVLNDPGRQCCKEHGVPIKCFGMCSGHQNDDKKNHDMRQANYLKLKQIGSCKKHLNAIRICQNLTKGMLLIFFKFLLFTSIIL